jgi:hypothetical protein
MKNKFFLMIVKKMDENSSEKKIRNCLLLKDQLGLLEYNLKEASELAGELRYFYADKISFLENPKDKFFDEEIKIVNLQIDLEKKKFSQKMDKINDVMSGRCIDEILK